MFRSLSNASRASNHVSSLMIFSSSLPRQYTTSPLLKINHARTFTTTASDPSNGNPGNNSDKGWRSRENRKEFFGTLQGLSFISAVWLFYMTGQREREKSKAELGRAITKDIEITKTKLKFLMNELDDFKRKTDSWKKLNKEDIDSHINLKKTNEYEEAFSFSMRMVSRYDTGLVPQVLQVEADYQNERLRRMTEILLNEKSDINKTKDNLDTLRKYFVDVYNVLNVVCLVTAANTIDKDKQSDEQKLLMEKLTQCIADDGIMELAKNNQNSADGKNGIITDEIREILHDFRKDQLEKLKAQKSLKKIDNTKLVRDEVFKSGGP